MLYKSELTISRDQARTIESYVTEEPDCYETCLSEYESISNTVRFPDGKFIDIKCCGVRYREGESNLAWTEAVLFDKNGRQLCYTEPSEGYLGEWRLETGDDEYVVDVIAA